MIDASMCWYNAGTVRNRTRIEVRMMLSGTKPATLRQVQLVDIHGTRFYDIAYTLDDAPDKAVFLRLLCAQPIVALGILNDLLVRLPGLRRDLG